MFTAIYIFIDLCRRALNRKMMNASNLYLQKNV